VPSLPYLVADRQYTAPSGADGVSLTPDAVAWADSDWVEVLAAAPAASVLTGVTVYSEHGEGSVVNYELEVDIGVGAAAAEVPIATVRGYNHRTFSGDNTGPTHLFVLPIPIDAIPSGARLAARMRSTNAAGLWFVAISYCQKPLTSARRVTEVAQTTLPPAAASLVLTAGSAWVSGTWSELRAASGAALVVTGLVLGNPDAPSGPLTRAYEVDLGIGPAASEVVITTLAVTSAGGGQPAHLMLPTPLDAVPASTRLAARLRSNIASATLRVAVMVLEKPL
jgi:hypothetical protein